MPRGPDLDASDLNKSLFFPVTMDQNSAYIKVKWIDKTPNTNQNTFHLEKLRLLPLRYGDSIQVLAACTEEYLMTTATNDPLNFIRGQES